MRKLFGLYKRGGRSDPDGSLDFTRATGEVVTVDFELKSTTNKNFTTARDLGPDHFRAWRTRYWIFGFYDKKGTTLLACYFATPLQIHAALKEVRKKIALDLCLGRVLSKKATKIDVYRIMGKKAAYDRDDAERLMKNQYSSDEYEKASDVPPDCYSPAAMTKIVQGRARYLMRRGATLNNPHIPGAKVRTFTALPLQQATAAQTLLSLVHADMITRGLLP